jgi:hypothetical protein
MTACDSLAVSASTHIGYSDKDHIVGLFAALPASKIAHDCVR